MRIITTLVLGALLIAVILVIQLYKTPEEIQPETSPLFPGLVLSSITKIKMAMYMDRKIVMEKTKGGRWRALSPFQDEIKDEEAKRILQCLGQNTRNPIQLTKDQRNLSDKGLSPAKHHITFFDSEGSHTLNIGSRTPSGDTAYVMIKGDDQLYSTGSNVLNMLELNPEDLRDDRLLRINPFNVMEVIIKRHDGVEMHAAKRAVGWEILAPVRCASRNIYNLISRLTSVKIRARSYSGVVTDELRAQYGLDKESVYTVILKTGPNYSKQVEIQTKGRGPAGDYLCIRGDEDGIVSLDALDFDKLCLQLNAYRSRVLLKPMRETFQTFKIFKNLEPHLEIERRFNEKYFEILHPFTAPADNVSDGNETPIYTYLVKADGLLISDFVADHVEDMSPYGLDKPSVILDFTWKRMGAMKNSQIIFGNETKDKKIYATVRDRFPPSSVYTVEKKLLDPLLVPPIQLRDRRIFLFPLDEGAVQQAAFKHKNKSFTITRGENGFFGEDPHSRFQAFLSTMQREQVIRFVPEPYVEEDPRFADIHGSLVMQVKEENQPQREVLIQIGGKGQDGWWGRTTKQKDCLFLLEDAFVEEFEKLFEDLPDQ